MLEFVVDYRGTDYESRAGRPNRTTAEELADGCEHGDCRNTRTAPSLEAQLSTSADG